MFKNIIFDENLEYSIMKYICFSDPAKERSHARRKIRSENGSMLSIRRAVIRKLYCFQKVRKKKCK